MFCNLPFFSAWHIPPYTHTGKRECWKEMVWRGSFYSNPLHKPEVKACPLPIRFGIKCSNISLWIHLNLGRVRGQEKSEMLENFRWPLDLFMEHCVSAVRSPGRQMVINLVFMGIRMYLRIGHSFSTLGWYLSPCILIEILHRWYQELLLAPIRCTRDFCSNGFLCLQVNKFHYCSNIDGIQGM